MKQFVKSYIRREDKTPIGTVVAIKDENRILYGYSLCNPKDKFDKKLGTAIAMARATSSKRSFPNVQDRKQLISTELCLMEDRAHRYFKI